MPMFASRRRAAAYDVNAKVVLITGAAGGIGAATARRLYAEGARLVLTDHDPDRLDALAAEFDTRRVLTMALDVTDAAATQTVVAQAVERFGRLDIALANAGIAWRDAPATMATCDAAEFERILEVNLLGVWRTIRAVLPEITRRRGQIVVTASIYAFINGMANAPYAASKAAVESLGRTLRVELAGTGASAAVVYPGWTATPIAEIAFGGHPLATRLNEAALPALLRRAVTPDAVAVAIVAGIARRRPHIVVPGRWRPIAAMRGLVNPLVDRGLARHPVVAHLLRRIESDTRNQVHRRRPTRARRRTAATEENRR